MERTSSCAASNRLVDVTLFDHKTTRAILVLLIQLYLKDLMCIQISSLKLQHHAQWSERWCTNLVAQGSIPGMSRSESFITRGKTQMMLLPPTSSL
jgi:hypothetical protein